MRVCLIATELFAHGVYGGFGVLTRDIARGLADKGIEVYVAMPRGPGQKPVEVIDNFIVVSYPTGLYTGLREAMRYKAIFELIDADVYHSEEPSLGTYLAEKAAPNKKHIITFQDPRTIEDWRIQWGEKPGKLSEVKFRFLYRLNINRAVEKADALFCQAKFVIPKAVKLYGVKKSVGFLPNPVDIPNGVPKKAEKPTVCFLGRWEHVKNPELFLELAERFPHVEFIAAGSCRSSAERDMELREKYKDIQNLVMPGMITGEQKKNVLERSWILINTSHRECLPVAFLEAASYRCAILSHKNPDDFASNFGYWAKEKSLEEFSRGLNYLLEKDRWRELGKKGYEYVKKTYDFDKVIEDHIKVYKEVLGERR